MSTLGIVYLSAANLADRLFMQDFVHRFKFPYPVVITHAPVASQAAIRMATRRISALLSEALVHNLAFTGEQRRILRSHDETIVVNEAAIISLLDIVPVLVLGPMASGIQGVVTLDGEHLFKAMLSLPGAKGFIFTNNPLSPLASAARTVDSAEEEQRLCRLYEEEADPIRRAYQFRPASLSGPATLKP